jgi:SAM-dependent methyltransferase
MIARNLMTANDPARTGNSLKDAVYQHYVSSNAWAHQPLAREAIVSFVSAYRYHLRDWLPAGDGRRWVDLGCGQGALLHLARELGFTDVLGVDGSAEMLAACRRDGLDVVQADVWDFLRSGPSAQYDVVSMFDLIEHFPKAEGFDLLREVHRILKPGGVCLLKLPNGASPWGFLITASDLTHEAWYTPYSIMQLATLAGFSGSDVREVGPAPRTLLSRIRTCLWWAVRALYKALNVIETGTAGRGIFTQVMLARAIK